jgi:ribonuclease D
MAVHLYKDDIPASLRFERSIAIDTEATGLNFTRDRLCSVQVSAGDGDAHIVHFGDANYAAPNLKLLLSDDSKEKIFHYARFDVAAIFKHLGVMPRNVYCTKIASKIARTYSELHGLKDLCKELLGVNVSKQQQCSYWGAGVLSKEQLEYAATDVLHLHKLRDVLEEMLKRERRTELAHKCFSMIEVLAMLDVQGWNGHEVFSHKSASRE